MIYSGHAKNFFSTIFMESQRIVIKVGSNIAVDKEHPQEVLRIDALGRLFQAVLQLQQLGYEVLVVLSGAVAAGRVLSTPNGVGTRQAQAAVGQWKLNGLVNQVVPKELSVGLVLLSREDVVNRRRFLTLQETFQDLLTHRVIPIVNENDATTIKDKNDFPDNDHLASSLAVSLNATHLFLLTNVEGLFSAAPEEPHAELLSVVENVNVELLRIASHGQSEFGRGGMVGKLQAARLATSAGVTTHILHGDHPEYMVDILSGSATHGTLCQPRPSQEVSLSNRDRWLIASKNADGYVQVDAGASRAIQQRRSLLAVGITAVYGSFHTGDTVEVIDPQRETLAVGQVEIDSESLRQMLSTNTELYNIQIIHADNAILICAGGSCTISK